MAASGNPLLQIQHYEQSIWLDNLQRGMFESGTLQRLIDEDGLRGMTSNPAIFEKAIDNSEDYDRAIVELAGQNKSAAGIYETLTTADVRRAADTFRPLYDRSDGRHGFVSLEVSPHLAYDTNGTIQEARHLWTLVDRPNIFIKVPATLDGLPAIRQLISEGINVNITLLFGLPRYRRVAEAYIAGIQDRLARGEAVTHVASVASFFLSRIDVLVDPLLEQKMQRSAGQGRLAESVHGEVAIASAKLAYQIYKEMFGSATWQALAERGARVQRLLWASTSTKNPAYSDIKYVEPLIGAQTVNTMPDETLDAYRDHGQPAARLEEGVDEARAVMGNLARLGINIDDVTRQLEQEGVDKFNKPYDKLLKRLQERRDQVSGEIVHHEPVPL